MSDLTKSKKYNQGIEDARDGFPMNRFMRNDPEYIAGYEHVTEDSKAALSGARKVDESPMCTRPDLTDCHAKINTGGRCMNGIQCEPIDDARKVNSLGSVRGDEHLGAMLPDDGARKVRP